MRSVFENRFENRLKITFLGVSLCHVGGFQQNAVEGLATSIVIESQG